MRILTTGILVTLCGCSVISSFDDYTVVEDAGMADVDISRDVPGADTSIDVGPLFDGGPDTSAIDAGPPFDGGPLFDAGPMCAVATPDRCGETCVDLQTNTENCGVCGEMCSMNNTCIDGDCILDDFQTELEGDSFRRFAYVRDVAVGPMGRIYATGFTDSDGDSSPSDSSRMFVAQFNQTSGVLNWMFSGDAPSRRDYGMDVEVVGSNVYVAGVSLGRMRAGTGDVVPGPALPGMVDGQLQAYVLRIDASAGGTLEASSVYDLGLADAFRRVGGPSLAADADQVVISFDCRDVDGDMLSASVPDTGFDREDLFVVGFDATTLAAEWSYQFDDQQPSGLMFDSGVVGSSSLLIDGDRVFVGIEQEAFTVDYGGTRITGPTAVVAALSTMPGAPERVLDANEVSGGIIAPTSMAFDDDVLYVGGTRTSGTAVWRRPTVGVPSVTEISATSGSTLRAITVVDGALSVALRIENDTTFEVAGESVTHVVADTGTRAGDALLLRLSAGTINSLEVVAEGPDDDVIGGMVRVDNGADVLGINIQSERGIGNMSIVRSLP